jgi:uncharacterized membrane protein YfcA
MSGTVAMLVMAGFGLAAGVGVTAVGPGGVLVTVGLFLASGLSPGQVAGTAIVTHLTAGGLGSLAYHRSGQLRHAETRRVALVLGITAAAGTPVGVYLNSVASGQLFGILLSAFLVIVALLVWFRAVRGSAGSTGAGSTGTGSTGSSTGSSAGSAWSTGAAELAGPGGETHPRHGLTLLTCLGLGVAIVGGMFGVGGPLLTVPLLVLAGTPVLSALGAAQVQSVVVASVGTLSYLTRGTIDWRLSLVTGIPELAGALVGWKIAHAVPSRTLRRVMIAALLISAGLIEIHG